MGLGWIPSSLLALHLAYAALAGDPDPVEAVEAVQIPAEAREAWATLDAVKQVRARFRQVQHRALLTEPLVSEGTLAFARPDQVRFEVAVPVRSVFVMRGSQVTTAMPDLDHRETVDLAASPEATRIVQGLVVWLGGDLGQVARDYDLAWTPGPPHQAVLTPRDPTLAKILKQITLTIDGAPLAVRRVVLLEPGGDRVQIDLQDIELDVELPDGTFTAP